MADQVCSLSSIKSAFRTLVFFIGIDTMKGSFYANPVLDEPDTTLEQKLKYPEYYSHNIWPTEDGIEDFEGAFKSLGR